MIQLNLHRMVGGKRMQRPWIIPKLPAHRRYVEAFSGSGSVLLGKPRSEEEFLIEIDPWQSTLLRIVRDHPKDLAERLRPGRYCRRTFIETRSRMAAEDWGDDLELAALVWTMRCLSRNGQMTSYSRCPDRDVQARWDNSVEMLSPIGERLQGVQIIQGSALEWMPTLDSSRTCFYVDPPYHPATRAAGRLYRFEMGHADHLRLLRILAGLSGFVCLSGYGHELYDDHLDDWNVARRSYSVSAAHSRRLERRTRKLEHLWMNY